MISVSSHDISDINIPQSVQKLYRRSNEVISDLKSLSRNVKSSTFCLDAYGSQLWPFLNNSVKLYYTAWIKVIRKAWCLPFNTHCRFLYTINNSLPIDVQLEKRCLKFLHSCINSSNEVFLYHQSNHEVVMVRELCIDIDENRFTVFTAEEMCHLVEYLCTI